jgi:cytochrome d ubiquinol oxidase subunit I
MKVTEAATANEGVWLTFLVVAAIYLVVGVTVILVLRGMSRRYREAGTGGAPEQDDDAPYGPRPPAPADGPASSEEVTVG